MHRLAAANAPGVPDGFHTYDMVAGQVMQSYVGYSAMVTAMNEFGSHDQHVDLADFPAVRQEFLEFFGEVAFAHTVVTNDQVPNSRLLLVATPNIHADSGLIHSAADGFAQDQPFPLNSLDRSNRHGQSVYGQYTPEQLSGTDPGNGRKVAWRLIQRVYAAQEDEIVHAGDKRLPPAQWPGLVSSEISTKQDRHHKVPSLLDAVTYWHTIRAAGHPTRRDRALLLRTIINHIDLPGVSLDGLPPYKLVPSSYIDTYGQPHLAYTVNDQHWGQPVSPRRLAIV